MVSSDSSITGRRSIQRTLRLLCSAAIAAAIACVGAEPPPLRLLSWNVGNPSSIDPVYANRLMDQAYEDLVGARLRALAPDLVFLQEVLAPARCERALETNPTRTCYDAAGREAPVRRLLGPDYSIACDARGHVECIGVHKAFGTIRGLPKGALALGAAETSPLPLPPCERTGSGCDDTRCDSESSVSAVAIETRRGPLRVVHVHPMAPGVGPAGVFFGEPCRERQLGQAFAAAGDAVPALIVGDFNLDPSRFAGARVRARWAEAVGPGRRFRDLTPQSPDGAHYATRRTGLGVSVDRVLAAGADGECTVYGRGLGPDPGTEPLDADMDWSKLPGGARSRMRIDHFAIGCELSLDASR